MARGRLAAAPSFAAWRGRRRQRRDRRAAGRGEPQLAEVLP